MAIRSIHWVFSNEANANEKIVVHDRKSADTLTEVLKAHEQVWVMKEEYSAPVAVAASPVQSVAPTQTVAPQELPEMHVEPSPLPEQKNAIPAKAKLPTQTEISEIISGAQYKQGAQASQTPVQLPGAKTPPPPMVVKPLPQAVQAVSAKANERRTQKRFNVDLRIILISRDRSFRSISKDVSLGGMKLKNRVPPEFSGQKCIAYISNLESKENIEMVCQVIADPNDPCRIQFSEPDSKQLKRLNEWLIENNQAKRAG